MSMYYGPELLRILQAERIREAQEENGLICCREVADAEAGKSVVNRIRDLIRRSPATCSC